MKGSGHWEIMAPDRPISSDETLEGIEGGRERVWSSYVSSSSSLVWPRLASFVSLLNNSLFVSNLTEGQSELFFRCAPAVTLPFSAFAL